MTLKAGLIPRTLQLFNLAALSFPPVGALVGMAKPYRPLDFSPNDWADGTWDRLLGPEEGARCAVVANLIRHHRAGARILDVGCGIAMMLDHLGDHDVAGYVGLDIELAAVERGRERLGARPGLAGRTSLLQGRAETFDTSETFDVVIFNECLYYFADPCEVIRRLAARLGDRGVVIASCYVSAETIALIRLIERRFRVEDSFQIVSRRGPSWRLSVLAAGRDAAPRDNKA